MIIVNADKIKVTGKKMDQKIYYHHSDYVGGMKETTLKEMMAKNRKRLLSWLLKVCFQRDLWEEPCTRNFFVYAGPEHKHEAQKPEVLTF